MIEEGMLTSSPPLPGRPHQGGTLTGQFRRHRMSSAHLHGDRNVTVMLPPSYASEPDREYPILYLQDGQNMFDRREGFMGREWGADEVALTAMQEGRMQEAIIVAVDHGGAGRLDDYSPVADPEYGGGGADDFLDFLTQEVDPMIRGQYRASDSKAAVAGSSMGGLVSLYAGFCHPDMFGAVGAMSPSLWWAQGHLAREVVQHQGPLPDKIWLDIGDHEGSADEIGQAPLRHGEFQPNPVGPNGVQDVRDRVREMGHALLHQGYDTDNLHYWEVRGGEHTEDSWHQRLDQLFCYLLPVSSSNALTLSNSAL